MKRTRGRPNAPAVSGVRNLILPSFLRQHGIITCTLEACFTRNHLSQTKPKSRERLFIRLETVLVTLADTRLTIPGQQGRENAAKLLDLGQKYEVQTGTEITSSS